MKRNVVTVLKLFTSALSIIAFIKVNELFWIEKSKNIFFHEDLEFFKMNPKVRDRAGKVQSDWDLKNFL